MKKLLGYRINRVATGHGIPEKYGIGMEFCLTWKKVWKRYGISMIFEGHGMSEISHGKCEKTWKNLEKTWKILESCVRIGTRKVMESWKILQRIICDITKIEKNSPAAGMF